MVSSIPQGGATTNHCPTLFSQYLDSYVMGCKHKKCATINIGLALNTCIWSHFHMTVNEWVNYEYK